MTRREVYEVIGKVFETGVVEQKEDVLAWVKKEVAALDAKNAKAKERAAAKRAEGDALRGRIEEVLTDEPKTIAAIIEALGEDDLTPAKVVARTRQLVNDEKAIKETIKVDNRKLVAYAKA